MHVSAAQMIQIDFKGGVTMIGILFIVVAVILLLMRRLLGSFKWESNKVSGIGVVKKRIQENCRIHFFVEFQDQNGELHVGESVPYKSTQGKYQVGESVKILYCFSPKGKAFCEIDDPDLISCEVEAKRVSMVMLIAAILLIALGAISLITYTAALLF